MIKLLLAALVCFGAHYVLLQVPLSYTVLHWAVCGALAVAIIGRIK